MQDLMFYWVKHVDEGYKVLIGKWACGCRSLWK